MNTARLGVMNFANNAYTTPDLYGPQGGLSLKWFQDYFVDVQGTLTIAGGTSDGAPSYFGVRQLIKSLEVKVSGTRLVDSYVELPLVSLVNLNMIQFRGANGGIPRQTDVNSGAAGVYTFRGVFRLPHFCFDMSNPYKFGFPSNRFNTTSVRIKWGTAEDLIVGGDRTKTISNCTATIIGVDHSGDPDFELMNELMFHQRVQLMVPSIAATENNKEFEIVKTNAFLRGLLIEQISTDANGVETPLDTIIPATNQLILRLNDRTAKFEDSTWEYFRYRNEEDYGKALPFNAIFMDFAPNGDEGLLRQMFMGNYQTIKIRSNVVTQTNGALRISAVKFAVQ